MVGPLRTFRPFSRFPKPNLPTDQSPAPYSGYSEGWPANLASNKSLAGRCMRWSPCYCSGRNPHARKPRLSGSSNDGPFSLSSSELSRALVGVMHQSIEVLYFCGVAGVSSHLLGLRVCVVILSVTTGTARVGSPTASIPMPSPVSSTTLVASNCLSLSPSRCKSGQP